MFPFKLLAVDTSVLSDPEIITFSNSSSYEPSTKSMEALEIEDRLNGIFKRIPLFPVMLEFESEYIRNLYFKGPSVDCVILKSCTLSEFRFSLVVEIENLG